jgi:hypothetical protein
MFAISIKTLSVFLFFGFVLTSCNSTNQSDDISNETEDLNLVEKNEEFINEMKDAEIKSASFTHKQLDSIFKIHWNTFRHSIYHDPDFDWY